MLQDQSIVDTDARTFENLPRIRKCLVRLRRMTDPNRKHTKSILQDQSIVCTDTKTSENIPRIRKCVIRLKRIPLNNTNVILVGKDKSNYQRNTNLCGGLHGETSYSLGEEFQSRVTRRQKLVSKETNISEAKKDQNANRDRIKRNHNFVEKKISLFAPELHSTICPVEENSKTIQGYTLSNIANNGSTVPLKLDSNTTHTPKFFHRNIQSTTTASSVLSDIQKECDLPRKSVSNVKKAMSSKPHSEKTKESVYDFLSQSHTTNSDNDPSADIIKKLIDEGKAVVATRQKGKSKPRLKRTNLKTKKPSILKRNYGKGVNLKKTKPTMEFNAIIEEEDNDDNDQRQFDNDVPLPATSNYTNLNAPSVRSIPKVLQNNKNVAISADGTFSRLARSVLIQQTEKEGGNHQNSVQRKLLAAARKFVSTPVTKKLLQPPQSHLSPIARPSGNKSPWRVDDDTPLPRAFNFNTNSSNLPSFSSDNIPETPKKEKNKNGSATKSSLQNSIRKPAQTKEVLGSNEPSSFSSNDSNAENQPPPSVTNVATTQHDENENIFNLRQFPNPRRTLHYRSPLKDINILEVVALPNWRTGNNNRANKEVPYPMYTENTLTSNNNDSEIPEPSKNATETLKHTNNIFGFEEYLDDDLPSTSNASNQLQICNQSKRNKLNALKRWRPDDDELLFPSTKRIRAVFDEENGRAKQRCIKEMLCSTMMNPKRTGGNLSDSDSNDVECNTQTTDADILDLFKDPDPETTFDDKIPHRTYVRLKRKKKRHHNFIMFNDSDESDEEEKEEPKKKAHRKDIQQNAIELNSFVNDFNDMCSEIEQYNLIVE